MIEHITRRQLIQRAKDVAKIGGMAAVLANIPYDFLARAFRVKPEYLPQAMQQLALSEAEAANYVGTAGTVPTGGNFANGIAELTTNARTAGDGVGSQGVDNTDASLIKNGGSKNILVSLVGGSITEVWDTRCTLSNIVMDTKPTVGIRLYSATTLNSLTYDWANNSADSAGFRFNFRSQPLISISTGWQYHQWFRDEVTTIGAGNWQSDFVLSRHAPSCPAGASRSVYLDQQYYGGYQRPVIVWILEGAHDTHYDIAFAAWQNKEMRGTLAIPTSSINTANKLRYDEIHAMVEDGWGLCHMSDTTTALTGLSVAAVEARLATAESAFEAVGWGRFAKYIALPGTTVALHRTDANVLTALANRGYKVAIDKWQDGTGGSGIDSHSLGVDPIHGISLNPYRVPAWRTESPDTITEHQAHVDHTVAAGGTRILRSGSIVTGAASGEIETADHSTLLTYLALRHHANTLSLLPIHKWYEGLHGVPRV